MGGGVRRYQNPDRTLTPAGRKRLEKADIRWAKKKIDKITAKEKKASQRELDAYGNELLKLPGARKFDGRLSAQTANAYNRKMAELMSHKTSELRAPSCRVVSVVAKRGEIGVFMALSQILAMALISIDKACIVLDELRTRRTMLIRSAFKRK